MSLNLSTPGMQSRGRVPAVSIQRGRHHHSRTNETSLNPGGGRCGRWNTGMNKKFIKGETHRAARRAEGEAEGEAEGCRPSPDHLRSVYKYLWLCKSCPQLIEVPDWIIPFRF
ncbi:hypothetical protein EVAR_46843_1 [Eumeta japonica]|uniref:Uncharacterized protein n=1 Tax=Eumeta variegata TaxID=151549 RepID=A0A4C1XS84_EUMVA|nr:hypothetical protein EVAR_46843_1 [Eumeta japonica]